MRILCNGAPVSAKNVRKRRTQKPSSGRYANVCLQNFVRWSMNGRARLLAGSRGTAAVRNDDSVPLPYRLLVNGYFGNVFALTHTHSRHRIFRGKMTKASAKNTNPTRSSPIFRFTTPNSLRSLRVLLFRRTKNNYFFNGKREGKKMMMEKQNVRAREIFLFGVERIFSPKTRFSRPEGCFAAMAGRQTSGRCTSTLSHAAIGL